MITTLAQRALPQTNAVLRNVVLALAGSLLVAVAAQVKVPFWPVPMTLQTLAVLLVGGAYGARLGAATLALYALEGAIGLPFFAGVHGGFAYLMGSPTTGYIVGFVLASALMGFAAERGLITSSLRMAIAALVASAVVYAPGLAWLAGWYGAVKGLGIGDAMSAAVMGGFVPFILGDVLKALIAGFGLSASWSLSKE